MEDFRSGSAILVLRVNIRAFFEQQLGNGLVTVVSVAYTSSRSPNRSLLY